MNAVSRFDTPRSRRMRGLPNYAPLALYALGGVVAVLLIFQLFFRYQYMEANGVTWRIDRLTQQTCQVDIGHARCEPSGSSALPKPSLSTSTSISTSTSLSLRPASPKHKH